MTAFFLSNSAPKTSLPEFVYLELRKAILNGVFTPGEVLRQQEVAEKLGVSRSPLREALPRLEAEGMVVLRPHRGYAVVELHPAEIQEVFELRILLECEVAKQAIQNRKEADIAKVYEIASLMNQSYERGTDEMALATWSDLNISFHDALLKPAGMSHYMKALSTARGGLESYIRTELRLTKDFTQAQNEHSLLAQAFVQGDVNGFVELTRLHSIHTRDRLLARLDT